MKKSKKKFDVLEVAGKLSILFNGWTVAEMYDAGWDLDLRLIAQHLVDQANKKEIKLGENK